MNKLSGQLESLVSTGQVELLHILTAPSAVYQCPGETLPINGAIHQARLRAHYKKCRDCPHREDTHNLSAEARQQLLNWLKHKPKAVAELQEGFRGIYLNQMMLQDVQQIAGAVCNWLWSEALERRKSIQGYRSTIVLGHDSRVTSLEVLQMAMRTVREQGAKVVDVGEVSASCLQFVVEQLNADAGIHATAAGCEETVIGLDIYGREGYPLSGESLHSLQSEKHTRATGRCGRTAGEVIPFPARKAYLGSLWKHFRGIPTARVLVACRNEFVWRILNDLQQELPVKFCPFPLTASKGQALPMTADCQAFQLEILRQSCDFGFWLDEVGQTCQFFDPQGEKIAAETILEKFLVRHHQLSPEIPAVLLGEEFQNHSLGERLENFSAVTARIRYRQSLREHFARGMKTSKARWGFDVQQRYWLQGNVPVCDGLVTLGAVLQLFTETRQ